MAYKDEYEVARLYADPPFLQKLNAQFDGDYKLHFHLAPPLLAKRNEKGELMKREFGSWMFPAFRLLAKLRFLRGSPFDIFGYSEERRTERQLIADYERTIEEVLSKLSPDNHGVAVQIASIPEDIRGFGHVKSRHLAVAKRKEVKLLEALRTPAEARAAAHKTFCRGCDSGDSTALLALQFHPRGKEGYRVCIEACQWAEVQMEKRVWVVVADSARARLFTADNAVGPLDERETLVNPEARQPQRDLVTDASGRSFNRFGPGRATLGHEADAKQHDYEIFARQIAQRLNEARCGASWTSSCWWLRRPFSVCCARTSTRICSTW